MPLSKTPSLSLLARQLIGTERRIMLFGAPGTGKSTLAGRLADELAGHGQDCACIGADPGSPAFGIPGAVCLGIRQAGNWKVTAIEPLCTLDAGRFRLPLADAVRRLLQRVPPGPLLVDSPGVVRGIAGSELLLNVTEAAGIDTIIVLTRHQTPVQLEQELDTSGAEVHLVPASPDAHRPGRRRRARARTALWDRYLRDSVELCLPLEQAALIGAPPPPAIAEAWHGRQAAVLDSHHRMLTLGEILALDQGTLRMRIPGDVDDLGLTERLKTALPVLVRDAVRSGDGLLNTAPPETRGLCWYTPPPDMLAAGVPATPGGPRPVVRVGGATVTLVNGLFGDPLLHLRLRHRKRSLLFDLGEAGRLPARIAHQVTDVFISHAHFDHIAGFLWLLRSRIGILTTCRIFGPPELTANIQGLVNGIHWDRIGSGGPRFDVTEIHADRLVKQHVQAGRRQPRLLDERPLDPDVILQEPEFRVRAVTLDHRTPVIAYAFEPARTLNVRKERLQAAHQPPGPWLTELKRRIAENDSGAVIEMPDGHSETAGALAKQLLLITPGKNLVYATDLADTRDNRRKLTRFAADAHTLFCEAVFASKDAAQAARTGHLTAQACGEIAAAAAVERLVPFHFSRRYEQHPELIYDELRKACPRAHLPPA